mmetsp:Transcript_1479/g.2353  ORF Transcript_1479/g.2353 Transcript_1479/m.2353 type:complete len:344 (-) Transcript_1479:60-1091(-)
MSSTGRGRKRYRASDNNENIQNNKNKKQRTNQTDKNNQDGDGDVDSNCKKTHRLQLVDLSEYNCCVCKDLSAGKILQCPNGCVICDGCYPRIQPCKCPICRTAMSRNVPIRCRLAEKTLALRLVTCKFDGCGKEIAFGQMKQHELDECEFKPIHCKYAELGCEWQGLRRNLAKHVSKCRIDQNAVLQRVQEYMTQLKLYREFIKNCKKIHQHSCGVSGQEAFEWETEEMFVDGYEHILKVKSTKAEDDSDAYQVCIQLCFAEDVDQLARDETIDLDLGVVIEPRGEDRATLNFMKEIKVSLSANKAHSDWIPLQPQLSTSRYQRVFRGGFDVKLFEFTEDDDY